MTDLKRYENENYGIKIELEVYYDRFEKI